MPSVPSPYTRILLHGVPYWRDTEGKLYLFMSTAPPTLETRIQIGTEAEGLAADWQERLAPYLQSYRTAQAPRPRATAAPAAAAKKS